MNISYGHHDIKRHPIHFALVNWVFNLKNDITKKTLPNGSVFIYAWRRPTLPGPCGPSTIGAGGLNGRVRDGYVWNPSAIATKRAFTA